MKKILSVFMTLVLLFVLVGCQGETGSSSESEAVSGNETADAASDKSFKIGITQWPGSYVWYGVEKMGLFQKNGVNATIEMFPVYSDGMNALASGNLDAFILSYSDAIAPYNQGGEFKIVMVEDYSAGSDGIVVKPEIKTLEDLKGKTVATEIGTVDQMFLNKCLEKAGLTESDINLSNMSIGDAGNAFIAGRVDAAVIWDPSLSLAVASGGNLLYTTKETPGLIPAVMAVNTKVLEEDRDAIKNIIKAWYEGLEVMETNHDEFVSKVAEGAEITVEDFENLMQGVKLVGLEENVPAFKNTEDYVSLTYCGMEHAKFLQSVGMLEKIPDSLEPLIDGSVINEIINEKQ